jgi:hypothetical protein
MGKRASATGITACSVLLQIILINASAQAPEDTISKKDTLIKVEKEKDHALYAGTGFGTNMVYLGTTMSQDRPFGYASLSYGFRDYLYFSAKGYTLADFSPFLAFYNLDLSFSHTFNSWFDIGLSLSRYSVAKALRDTLFNSFTYANATLGVDWRILYTQISAGELFAEENYFYFQVRNSRYFETPSFADDKAFFSFDPYINLLLGPIISVETVEGTRTTISPGNRHWKRYQSSSTTQYTEKFGLMEIDFGLPIDFSYDFFTLEIEPGYVLPLYSDTWPAGMEGFLFLVSAYFRIF